MGEGTNVQLEKEGYKGKKRGTLEKNGEGEK